MKSAKAVAPHESKQVGIWIRVSTEDQARGESPAHHEARARNYAESKEWQVVEVYHLEGVSGKAVMDHPEAKRMLADIKRGNITGLIFSKLARLARNTKELLEFSDFFKDHDADLISLGESIDTSTPAGRLFYTVTAATTQFEREEIASRVAASVPIRAKLGKPLGGAAPYGYQWKDKKLAPDLKEAPIRRLMYELFLEHKRIRTVTRLLNEQGYRTRVGAKFSPNTVDRLIRDPVAKGTRRANYTKSLGQKKHWKLKPEKDWILTPVEAIVSEELWEQCNSILEVRTANAKPVAKKTKQLFAGFTFCECGTKMYVPSNLPKYYCQKCHNKFLITDLEIVFREQLKSFLFSPDDITRALEQTDRTIREKQEQLGVLQNRQKKVRQNMDKIFQLYLDERISADLFGSQYPPLETQAKQMEDQIPARADVSLIGQYKPLPFKFGGFAKGIRAADLAGK